MVDARLPVSKIEQSLSLGDLPFADILSPYCHKGERAFSTFWIRRGDAASTSFRVELGDTGSSCVRLFNAANAMLSMPAETCPYDLTPAQWGDYAISPHSYMSVGDGQYQIGLNYFNRFMQLDVYRSEVRLLDPGVEGDFLSTTNWFDAASDEIWFASWNAVDAIYRNIDPRADVTVRIWRGPLQEGRFKQVWEGTLGDSLHQLAVNPDKKFLIAAELGLRSDRFCAPAKLVPSRVLFLSLETGRQWHLEMPAAAHIEFDPSDPAVCYLSGHNIGLVGPKVGIFGPGMISKVRLTPDGPRVEKTFSHPDFHRITSHIVFSHREKTLIAASGYPGSVFLIDAACMDLFKIIDMRTDDPVDTSCGPHLCRQDSYGLCASDDGRHLLAVTTGGLRVFDLETGGAVLEEPVEGNCSFTGHAARIQKAQD